MITSIIPYDICWLVIYNFTKVNLLNDHLYIVSFHNMIYMYDDYPPAIL